VKVKSEQPVTAQCGKMQPVTTLCRFRRGVSEICAVTCAVLLIWFVEFFVRVKMVGATSSEGFLVACESDRYSATDAIISYHLGVDFLFVVY